MLICINNFVPEEFDETFFMDAVSEFETRGVENYPFRSLYVDDIPTYNTIGHITKSISLIQNWDSISDQECVQLDISIIAMLVTKFI